MTPEEIDRDPPSSVLVASDDQETLAALDLALRRAGFDPVLATSGKQALHTALREPISAIVLGLHAPEMDSLEAAHHLKSVDRTRGIPVLVLGREPLDARDVRRAYDIGVADFVLPPVDPVVIGRKVGIFDALARAVRTAERRCEAQRERDRRLYEARLSELRVTALDHVDKDHRILMDVAEMLGSSLNVRTTLPRVLERLVPDLADFCTVDEVTGDDAIRQLADAHVDADRHDWLRALAAHRRFDRTAALGIARVRRTARGELHRDVADPALLAMILGVADSERELLGALEAGSCLLAPVSAGGRVLGVITLVRTARRPDFTPADAALAEEIAHRVAVAIDNAALHEAARRAADARDRLLALVSHDLRNPLSSIVSCADLLERLVPPEDARIRQLTDIIALAAGRIERLTSDILDFAHLQENRMSLERATIGARELLEGSAVEFEARAAEKRVALSVRSDELVVSCDRDRMLQVLRSLVDNALRHTPEGGSIELRAEQVDDEIVFSVADTGPGIPREEVPFVFDHAFRLQRGRRSGLGLGLAIAKGLVESHGGRIWLESAPSRGTTFFFALPSADETPDRDVAGDAPAP